MQTISKKQARRRKPQEEVVKILAEKYRCSQRKVQRVISGDLVDEDILLDYLSFKEKENLLLQEVKRIAPALN